jgi:hypothetical protein
MDNKYHNKVTVRDGHLFDSKKEAQRYTELSLLEKAGIITQLELQKDFELIPKQKGERAVKYIADFYYYDNEKNRFVAEDVKGMKTQVYILKRKLFKYRYPDILFREV